MISERSVRSTRQTTPEVRNNSAAAESEHQAEIKRRIERVRAVIEQKIQAQSGLARQIINRFRGKGFIVEELKLQQEFIRDVSFNLSNNQMTDAEVEYLNKLYTTYQQEQSSAVPDKTVPSINALVAEISQRPEGQGRSRAEQLAILRQETEAKLTTLQEKALEAWSWNRKSIELELWQAQLTIDLVCEELQSAREQSKLHLVEEVATVPLQSESESLSPEVAAVVMRVQELMADNIPLEQWGAELSGCSVAALTELRQRVDVELRFTTQDIMLAEHEVGERVATIPTELQRLLSQLVSDPIAVGWITTPAELSRPETGVEEKMAACIKHLQAQRRQLAADMEQTLAEQRFYVYAQSYQMPRSHGRPQVADKLIERLGASGSTAEDKIRQAGYELGRSRSLDDKGQIRQALATLWDQHQKYQRWSKRAELLQGHVETMQSLQERAKQRLGAARLETVSANLERLRQRFTTLQGYYQALEQASIRRRSATENLKALAQAFDHIEVNFSALTNDHNSVSEFEMVIDEYAEVAGATFEERA